MPNYQLLNNPNSHGLQCPKEWQHHVPVQEDAEQLAYDIALIINTSNEPTTVNEVKEQPDWPEWKKAMDAKIEQLKNLDTYKIIELPANHTPITNKWVYHLKHNHNGNIVHYKACLIARGFSQIPGIDFTETFTLVMCLDTLQLLLAITAKLELMAYAVTQTIVPMFCTF